MTRYEITHQRFLAVQKGLAVVTSIIEADDFGVTDNGDLLLYRKVEDTNEAAFARADRAFFALPKGAWMLIEEADPIVEKP